jgi:hypothetical protein
MMIEVPSVEDVARSLTQGSLERNLREARRRLKSPSGTAVSKDGYSEHTGPAAIRAEAVSALTTTISISFSAPVNDVNRQTGAEPCPHINPKLSIC